MESKRYFIRFSYDGTAYHGWQIQPNSVSVQETLQGALSTLLRREVEVVGAGRTDAGVHARMMVAHFDWPSQQENSQLSARLCRSACPRTLNSLTGSAASLVEELSTPNSQLSTFNSQLNCSQLVYKLNKLLPPDIAVQEVYPVAADLHARFSATSRTYHYFIHLAKSPFLRPYSWYVYTTLDFSRMNEAARLLLDYEDFTSFSKTHTDAKTNLCRVTHAVWEETEDGGWRFTITANRFLRNMVRAIVGTLVEVGRGRMTIDEFRQVIESRNRCVAGESVPGHALFLVDIQYPPSHPCSPEHLPFSTTHTQLPE